MSVGKHFPPKGLKTGDHKGRDYQFYYQTLAQTKEFQDVNTAASVPLCRTASVAQHHSRVSPAINMGIFKPQFS